MLVAQSAIIAPADKSTGLVTAPMRFAAGAVLPDHEHVKIEQTYVGKVLSRCPENQIQPADEPSLCSCFQQCLHHWPRIGCEIFERGPVLVAHAIENGTFHRG